MTGMTTVFLVRHGESAWHADNRYTGRTDVPLTGHGRQQAKLLARWAVRTGLDALWTSPLRRALDTAAPVAEATGLRPRIDQRLVELDFGTGEGLTAAEMSERFPDARRAFDADPVANHLPGGEDPEHAVRRAARCLADVAGASTGGKVLVVGHSTLHRLLLCHLLGLPLHRYRAAFPDVRNCGVTTIRYNGTGQAALIEYNLPIQETE